MLSGIGEWVPKFDVLSLVLGALLGAFLSTWYGYFMTRPKLRVSGGGNGSGPGEGFRTHFISIVNCERILGIRLLPSSLLGKRIHDFHQWGIPVDTLTARNVSAHLFDTDNEHIAQLFWRTADGIVPYLDLASRTSGSLMVFAEQQNGTNHYFPYAPEGNGSDTPLVPTDGAYFDQSKTFEIRVSSSHSMKPLKIPFKVKRQFKGGLSFQSA